MRVYAWQHKIFHMQNAKVRCGNNKTNHGISTRQDVEFRQDMAFSQDVTFP